MYKGDEFANIFGSKFGFVGDPGPTGSTDFVSHNPRPLPPRSTQFETIVPILAFLPLHADMTHRVMTHMVC